MRSRRPSGALDRATNPRAFAECGEALRHAGQLPASPGGQGVKAGSRSIRCGVDSEGIR